MLGISSMLIFLVLYYFIYYNLTSHMTNKTLQLHRKKNWGHDLWTGETRQSTTQSIWYSCAHLVSDNRCGWVQSSGRRTSKQCIGPATPSRPEIQKAKIYTVADSMVNNCNSNTGSVSACTQTQVWSW